jgi:hypothetical protein
MVVEVTYLCLGIGVDLGKFVRENRNQDSDQHDVTQDRITNEDDRAKYRMKRFRARETEVRGPEEDLAEASISSIPNNRQIGRTA